MKRLVIAIQSLLSKKKLQEKEFFEIKEKRRIKVAKIKNVSKSFSTMGTLLGCSSCTRRAYLRYFKN